MFNFENKVALRRVGLFSLVVFLLLSVQPVNGMDVQEIKQRGELRHLGVPYANFITGSGDGLDVELVKKFAEHLGVRYRYVKTSWANVIGDLSGKKMNVDGEKVIVEQRVPIKGDIIANGMTILPWREKVVDFSIPIFPTQVWLVTRADSPLKPIIPSESETEDIHAVKTILKNHEVMGKANTCLDPVLYGLENIVRRTVYINGRLNELAPAVINGEAEATLLDVPDALIALEKWGGEIKIIGPISNVQSMACAFRKESSKLRKSFNKFLDQCKADGTYTKLVKKYYPNVFSYFPDFFSSY